ncbi:hypothetical protein ABZT51_49565, partial [Streptomyces sp. NPDC005373]|uniref:hypothetical protein n=1 Tax=Streptomyces sp. NPDC005373 TaxID=3156879 RepID=UPI0033B560D2
MAYLPAPSPVPEPAPEVLLDAIDDELESIAHDGAGRRDAGSRGRLTDGHAFASERATKLETAGANKQR